MVYVAFISMLAAVAGAIAVFYFVDSWTYKKKYKNVTTAWGRELVDIYNSIEERFRPSYDIHSIVAALEIKYNNKNHFSSYLTGIMYAQNQEEFSASNCASSPKTLLARAQRKHKVESCTHAEVHRLYYSLKELARQSKIHQQEIKVSEQAVGLSMVNDLLAEIEQNTEILKTGNETLRRLTSDE